MMNAVLADIKERLPNFMIIWSHIFKHACWSNVVANLKGEKCRHRINCSIAIFILKKLNGKAIGYPDTCIYSNKRRLNRLDWVHLIDLGTGVFMGTTKRALKNKITQQFENYLSVNRLCLLYLYIFNSILYTSVAILRN